jgi:hypothetical protein
MKHIPHLVVLLVALGVIILGIRYELNKKAQGRREAAYQSVFRIYTQALKPGMTRKEVEDYLQAKNSKFLHMCCVDSREIGRHSWDDLTKIGQEDPPWFCSENNVYVAFQFADHVHLETGFEMQDDDLDTLKAITLHHQLETCF